MHWMRQGTKRDLYSKQLNLNLLKQIPDESNFDNGIAQGIMKKHNI